MKSLFVLGFYPNPRICKRINLLKTFGSVNVVCWDKMSGNELEFHIDGISWNPIKVKADASNPIKRLLPLQKFKKQALKIIRKERPDLLYVQGLDMLQIACQYKAETNEKVRIVSEIADLHRLLVDKQTHLIYEIAQKYLQWQDKKLHRQVDILVVTSPQYYDTHYRKFVSKEKVFFFSNVPDLSAFGSYQQQEHEFCIGYIGALRYIDELKQLLKAGKETQTNLLFAGFENGSQIKDAVVGDSSVYYHGKYDYELDVANLYGKCDAIYSVYPVCKNNVKVALPNKLYESIYCELPIIVSKGTYLGEIVENWGVGVAIIPNDIQSLKETIKRMKADKKWYLSLQENCRKHKSEMDVRRYNDDFQKYIERAVKSALK